MVNPKTANLCYKYWSNHLHPYKILEASLSKEIKPGARVLEQGCGRKAPLLRKYLSTGAILHGVDLVDFTESHPGMDLVRSSIEDLPFDSEEFDLIFSRSVMEHVQKPEHAFEEAFRVLKKGGRWIFLTPNRWDYVSVISRLIPNRFHGKVVNFAEGRKEEDVFPVVYKANSWWQINTACKHTGFRIQSFDYLGQDPQYFGFSPFLYRIATAYEKMLLSTKFLKVIRGWLFVVLEKP